MANEDAGLDSPPLVSRSNSGRALIAREGSLHGHPSREPKERRVVGPSRLRTRDLWNLQELRLGQVLAQQDLQYAQGLTEHAFHELVTHFQGGVAPEAEEFQRMWRLARRGRSVGSLVSLGELDYVLRTWDSQVGRCLLHVVSQPLSLWDFDRFGEASNAGKLHALLDVLNERQPVPCEDVGMVMEDAVLLAGGPGVAVSRADLLHAIAAWYSNVQRQDTNWLTILNAWLRDLFEREYHLEVLQLLPQAVPWSADGVKALDALEDGGRDDGATARGVRAVQAAEATAAAIGVLAALVLPSFLCAWLVYIGATRGSNQCPKDLDGLLAWFGLIVLAALVLDCTGRGREDGPSFYVVVALKLIALAFPWVGGSWTYNLSFEERQHCDGFLVAVSYTVWSVFIIVEFFASFALCWRVAAVAEHEISLRQALRGELV